MYFDGTVDFPLSGEIIANFGNGLEATHMALSPQYKDKCLPGLLSGVLASCFALTEPDADSDVRALPVTDGGSEIQRRTIVRQLIRSDPEP